MWQLVLLALTFIDAFMPVFHLSPFQSCKLLLALASTVILELRPHQYPWPYFSLQTLHVFKWVLLFDKWRGLITTGHFPSTGEWLQWLSLSLSLKVCSRVCFYLCAYENSQTFFEEQFLDLSLKESIRSLLLIKDKRLILGLVVKFFLLKNITTPQSSVCFYEALSSSQINLALLWFLLSSPTVYNPPYPTAPYNSYPSHYVTAEDVVLVYG